MTVCVTLAGGMPAAAVAALSAPSSVDEPAVLLEPELTTLTTVTSDAEGCDTLVTVRPEEAATAVVKVGSEMAVTAVAAWSVEEPKPEMLTGAVSATPASSRLLGCTTESRAEAKKPCPSPSSSLLLRRRVVAVGGSIVTMLAFRPRLAAIACSSLSPTSLPVVVVPFALCQVMLAFADWNPTAD